jgi:hypothetical protein
VVAKIVDTLRSLLSGDATKLAQHTRVNEQSLDSYLLGGWRWNESRYGTQRSLREMVDVLNKVRPHAAGHYLVPMPTVGNHIDRQHDEEQAQQLQRR